MATAEQVNIFISNLSKLAIAEAEKRDKWVLPSVCIAQAALETGWGTSPLMKKANAYFGIKATGWKGKVFNSSTLECYDGKTYQNVNACFRAYDSVEDSVKDYFDLITTSSRYSAAVNEKDAEKAIKAIKNGGYATDPTYVDKIIKIILTYNLTQYDNFGKVFDGELSGNDIPRYTDKLVVYFKGLYNDGRTGTNKWGYEVAIDKNGVVLEDPHYSGNTKIPVGGKVLSGHGIAGKWIYNNIRKGYVVWFENKKAHIGKGTHHSIDSFNGQRLKDFLCVYNNGFKCPTNEWGTEVSIINGKAEKPIYGVGKMEIPKGGFVVSGHGKASEWVLENIKKGSKVSVIGNVLKVTS